MNVGHARIRHLNDGKLPPALSHQSLHSTLRAEEEQLSVLFVFAEQSFLRFRCNEPQCSSPLSSRCCSSAPTHKEFSSDAKFWLPAKVTMPALKQSSIGSISSTACQASSCLRRSELEGGLECETYSSTAISTGCEDVENDCRYTKQHWKWSIVDRIDSLSIARSLCLQVNMLDVCRIAEFCSGQLNNSGLDSHN
ncbi:hypothetical protein Q1695_003537 [Nippostrongylus brasiliensis]|nr:hypothetical protein Q1695_003537 [Nippostrongylus brasiliensis]